MGGGSFNTLFQFAIFFLSVWTAGKTAKLMKVSAIIPEILVGLLLGPELQNWLPETYSICHTKETREKCKLIDWSKVGFAVGPGAPERLQVYADPRFNILGKSVPMHVVNKYGYKCAGDDGLGWDKPRVKGESEVECLQIYCEKYYDGECSTYPDVFTLIGHLGVSLMIFESGMHFHFPMLPVVGPKASVVAILGTLGPILVGGALAFWIHNMSLSDADNISSALTAGVAMAPTSVGIALTLLMETKQLDQNFGQTIIAAAFLDDILSLIAFSLLFSFDENGVTFPAFYPLIFGTIFLLAGGYLAAKVVPAQLDKFFVRLSNSDMALKHHGKWSFVDNVHLVIMFSLLIGYSLLTSLFGSHLWGCFIAGMSFSGVPGSIAIWSRQTKRVSSWMMKIFFAGTVGLTNVENMMYGLIIGAFACIGPKVSCAAWIGRERWVIGWAMCGRAEFAYLIAAQGRTARLIDDSLYAQTLWALICATICAPVGFVSCLRTHIEFLKQQAMEQEVGQSRSSLRKSLSTADASKGLPATLVSSPTMPLAELFDKNTIDGGVGSANRAALMKCIRLRVLFRTAPKRSVEDIFAENECQLTKISTVRMEDGVVAIYAIRVLNRMRYADLRKIRLLAWEKLNGGHTGNNVKEINFLPPDDGKLQAGLLRFSIMCGDTNLLARNRFSLASLVAEICSARRSYIMQWNYSAAGINTICDLVAYPLPNDEETEANGTLNKLIHPMDNVVCSEDVSEILEDDCDKIQNDLEEQLEAKEVKSLVHTELLAFEASPLRTVISMPTPAQLAAPRGKLIYVEILYSPKPQAKTGYSVEAHMQEQGIDTHASTMVVSDGYMKAGVGLTVRDAEVWTAQNLPKILKIYEEKGWKVLHLKLDHMPLIEKPLFFCVLEVRTDDVAPETGVTVPDTAAPAAEPPAATAASAAAENTSKVEGIEEASGGKSQSKDLQPPSKEKSGILKIKVPSFSSPPAEGGVELREVKVEQRSNSLGVGMKRPSSRSATAGDANVAKLVDVVLQTTSSILDLSRFWVGARFVNDSKDAAAIAASQNAGAGPAAEEEDKKLARRPVNVPAMRTLQDLKYAFCDSIHLDAYLEDPSKRAQTK